MATKPKITPQQFRQMATMYDAGLDITQAIENISKDSDLYLQPVVLQLKQGTKLSTALKHSKVITPYETALLETGEQSGKLSGALKHHLTEQKTQLEQTTNLFFEWLPRFYYVLVIALVLSRFP